MLEIFAEDGSIALEVALEGGHHGGDVGEDEIGQSEEVEAHAGYSAAGAELHGAFSGKLEEGQVGVVVVVVVVVGWGPTLGEFDEYQGAGPDSGTDVESAVVLLKGEDGVPYWELYHWRVRELHTQLLFAADVSTLQ